MDISSNVEERHLLCQQPSQCVIVDLGEPLSHSNLTIIAECLHQVLPIVGVLPGPPRIPLFSIVMANNANGLPEEIVLGFEKVRGNFAKCFEALRSMHTEFHCTPAPNRSQSISAALIKALNLYQIVNKRPGTDHELEVTVISSSVGYKVGEQVLKAISVAGAQSLKGGNLLRLHTPTDQLHWESVTIFGLVHDQYKWNIDELELSADEEQEINDASDLVNIQHKLLNNTAEDDRKVLTKHLMCWLADRSKDSHHLELALPHPYNEGEELLIKFDLKELMLPTSALPFHNTTNLELTSAFIKPPHFATKSDVMLKYTVPIHRLKVLHQVPYTNQLIPYLYGTPMVLEATQCWQVDWDELETNKCSITALHASLLSKNIALVCQLEVVCCGEEELSPRPYYCIAPTVGCLLVHHLAYKDLFIYPNGITDGPPPHPLEYQAKIDMEMSLNQVAVASEVDPQELNGAGYIKHITRSILPKRLTHRKRPVTSSNSSKRKAKYTPLDGYSSAYQPMEISSSTGNANRKPLQDVKNNPGSSTMMSSMSSTQPQNKFAKLMPLPVLKKPLKSRITAGRYVQPSIATQIQHPQETDVKTDAEPGRHWVSRDNSLPLPLAHSFPAANIHCTSVPASYTRAAAEQSVVKDGGHHGRSEFAPENGIDCERGDEQGEENLSSPLSPMQYDGLSQFCQAMIQSPSASASELDCQSRSETSLDSDVTDNPPIRTVSYAGSSYPSHKAVGVQFAHTADGNLSDIDETDFIEHADGTLSPQWQGFEK